LEKIISQNKKIISLLEERRNGHERETWKENRGINQ
jgi:hypothetical protein